MNRKIFSLSMFKDALRRTAVIGLISTVLLSLAAFLVFYGHMVAADGNTYVTTMSFQNMHATVIAVPFVVVPLLVISLFGFLNKRSTSDFWHSVPFTRECIYLSFSAAIFAWVLISTLLSSTVSVILFSLVPKYFAINMLTVICSVISVILMSLLVLSAFLIAMSLTGTIFNNIVVSLIILFLPRIFIFVLQALQSNSYLFDFSSRFLEEAITLNQVFGVLGSISAMLYTFFLAAIYFVVGMLLFKRRKSEAAANSSVNKFMQAVFRLAISFTVCLIPLSLIVDELHTKNPNLSDDNLFVIITLYIVAIVAFFLYELISTTKAKNMLKAAPSLGILLVMNLAFFAAAHFGYLAEFNYTPTPEKISAVRFSQGYMDSSDYFENAIFQIEVDDENIQQILCDSYYETRDRYQKGMLRESNRFTVGFKTAFGYKYRTVTVNDQDNQKLLEYISETEEYKQIFDVEKLLDKAITTNLYVYYDNRGTYTEEDEKAIINCFKEEIKALDKDKWFDIVTTNNIMEDVNGGVTTKIGFSIARIAGSVADGLQTYSFDFSISNLLPKTYDLVMSKIFEHQTEDAQKTLEFLNDFKMDSEENKEMMEKYHTSVNLYNGTKMTEHEYYSINSTKKAKALYDVLSKAPHEVANHKSRIAIVNVNYYDTKTYKYHDYMAIFKVPDDADLTFLLSNDIDDSKKESDTNTDTVSSNTANTQSVTE